MADLGADVVKIEAPGVGDDTRHWGPPFQGDQTAYFPSVKRNKRSAAFDLKDPDGIRVVRSLAAEGQTGPDSQLPGCDAIAQARGGIMSVTGESVDRIAAQPRGALVVAKQSTNRAVEHCRSDLREPGWQYVDEEGFFDRILEFFTNKHEQVRTTRSQCSQLIQKESS